MVGERTIGEGGLARSAGLFVGLLHASLFLVAGWLALAIASEFATGLYGAAPVFLVLAVLVVGAVRAARGIVGGRRVLMAADIGLAVLLGAHVASTGPPFLEVAPTSFGVGIGLAMLAAASTVVLRQPGRGIVQRRVRDRAMLAALIAVDAVSVVGLAILAASDFGAASLESFASYAVSIAGFDLAVFVAWWWGCRWPIAAGGIGSLARVGVAAVSFEMDVARALLLLAPQVLAVAAWFVRPEVVGESRPAHAGWRPAVTASRPADAQPSRPARAWIAVGAVLWPLLVLFGNFPPVSDWCPGCGPRFAGDELLAAAGVMTVPLVPLLALVALGWRRLDDRATRVLLGCLLAAAVLLLIEIAAGLLGVVRFGFLVIAAAPVLLVLLGAVVALARPVALASAGWVASFAAAGLVVVWSWSLVAGLFGPSTEAALVVASLAQAAAAALGMAYESSRAAAGRHEQVADAFAG